MNLHKTEAIEKATEIVKELLTRAFRFAIRHNPSTNQIIITGKSDADTMKYWFPIFEIKQDIHKTRYVELVINYHE